jgi:hypothetical protein
VFPLLFSGGYKCEYRAIGCNPGAGLAPERTQDIAAGSSVRGHTGDRDSPLLPGLQVVEVRLPAILLAHQECTQHLVNGARCDRCSNGDAVH